MGMIPARAWDTEGVTSLRALQAPFLVTTNDLTAQVVRADMANEMLTGLDKAGVTGLALVPESLRIIYSFGKPFLSLRNFEGVTIRVPTSNTSSQLFDALGATADDLVDPTGNRFDEAIAKGTVAGVEGQFPSTFDVPTAVTANLVPFPKVNTLVINHAKFAQLTQAQQTMLRIAAVKTRDWGVETIPDTATSAAQYCKDGGTVTNTTDAKLADIQRATQPVYTQLEEDPQTKSFIDQIHDLKDNSGAPTRITPCTR